MVQGGRHDGVVPVEVAVRQVVAHAGYVLPWDLRLARQHVGIDVLDRLTDLDESHPDRVEDQAVGQGSVLEMRPDRRGRTAERQGRWDSLPPRTVERLRTDFTTPREGGTARS